MRAMYDRCRWVGLLSCVLAGCGGSAENLRPMASTASTPGPASLVCPEAGGATWHELVTARFVYDTDLPLEKAQRNAAALEAIAGALDALMGKPADDGRTVVVDFARESDFHVLRPGRGYGGFRLLGEPRPSVLVGGSTAHRVTFLLALARMNERFPSGPIWLRQGLADYFSTMSFAPDAIVLAKYPWSGPLVPVADALAVKDAEFYGPRFDAFHNTDYAFVHLLRARYAERLKKYIAAIEAGAHHDAAWRNSFGDVPLDKLQAEVAGYSQAAPETIPVASRRAAPAAPTVRELADAEIHALWLAARDWDQAKPDAIEKDLAEVRRLAPDSGRAHYFAAWRLHDEDRPEEAAAELEKAAAAGVDEETVLFRRLFWDDARAKKSGAPVATLLPEVRRLGRIAKQPSSLNNIAWMLAVAKLPDEGLPFARRALALRPLYPAALDTLAFLLYEKGDVRGALETQERALAILNDDEPSPLMLEHLKLYRTAGPTP